MIKWVAGGCLILASCSSTPSSSLSVSDGWSRPTPPITNVAAFYFVIENATDDEDALVSASSDACQEMEVHESILEDDIMGMGAIDEIVIGAGQTVAFEPNGLHLMCLGLTEPVEAGDVLDVAAVFRSGAELSFAVTGEDR